jgi:hypothetical protein
MRNPNVENSPYAFRQAVRESGKVGTTAHSELPCVGISPDWQTP